VGTLEEALEILSLVQLRLTRKPLVFINTRNYFDGLLALFHQMVDWKFAKAETLAMYHVAATPEDALQYMEAYVPPEVHSKWL